MKFNENNWPNKKKKKKHKSKDNNPKFSNEFFSLFFHFYCVLTLATFSTFFLHGSIVQLEIVIIGRGNCPHKAAFTITLLCLQTIGLMRCPSPQVTEH